MLSLRKRHSMSRLQFVQRRPCAKTMPSPPPTTTATTAIAIMPNRFTVKKHVHIINTLTSCGSQRYLADKRYLRQIGMNETSGQRAALFPVENRQRQVYRSASIVVPARLTSAFNTQTNIQRGGQKTCEGDGKREKKTRLKEKQRAQQKYLFLYHTKSASQPTVYK